ncbi:MAG: DUF4339 domain-containing protein [Candidatus Udaeobacter sp.]
MRSYLLKISGREEGPLADTQVAQMFANGRIDRNTPCKPTDQGDWKSVDDYLPMLKYGTQLPPRAEARSVPPTPMLSAQRVSIVDFDIPFGSKNHVQMDGRGVHRPLLFITRDDRGLAHRHGGRRNIPWRLDVEPAPSVMCI